MRFSAAVLGVVVSVVPSAFAQALEMRLLRAQAEAGNPVAQARLGLAYVDGEASLPDDPAQGLAWIQKSAAQGNPVGQFAMGMLYQWGRGVAKDEAAAAEWYRKAAEQGHATSQAMLGEFYRDGRGVKKDEALAVKWYRKAAEAGDEMAQFDLAILYRSGRGTAADPVEAHKWFMLAAARVGHPETAQRFAAARDQHALEITKAQAGEAQQRARDWMDGFMAVEDGIDLSELPEAPAPAAPVRVGGEVKEPKRLKYVTPAYPDIAKQARVQGVVIVEAVIGPDGKVREVEVLRGIPLLDAAAIEAVKQWEYSPTLLNGVPVPIIMTITVDFKLS